MNVKITEFLRYFEGVNRQQVRIFGIGTILEVKL